MTLLLRIWKDGNPASATDHPFEQEVIGIGRDPSNAVQLERSDVSKNHARIEQKNDGLVLIDLKSRNGTFLNGSRIIPENPRPIGPGDKVRICDVIVEVVSWDQPGVPVAPASEDPFPDERKPPLFTAVEHTPLTVPVDASIMEEGERRADRAERECEHLTARRAVDGRTAEEDANRLAAAEEECRRLQAEVRRLEGALASAASSPPPVGHLDESLALERLKAVLGIVLQPLIKIMRGRILFRSEFTGATMFQDPRIEALSKQTSDEWMAFFLDADLSEEASHRRLELIDAEAEEIIPHVMGLLEGYKKSIDIGTKAMLKQLDPGRLREELLKKPLQAGIISIPYRFLPFLSDRIAWKALENRYREMEEEDRGNLEQRFFRPAFIQGYVACLSSARYDPLRSRPIIQTSKKAQP